MSFPFHLPLILDGATGTNLIAAGMPSGVCVEQWILEHPERLLALQRAFLEAGSNAVMAPTFGANREKLAAYGLQDQVEEINLKLVALSKEAAEPFHALVGGDVSPAGVMIEPYGDLTFDELYDIYLEQIRALKKAGVDFIALETQMSLADLRAGVLAAKEAGLPVFATITVEDNGRTIMGTKFLPVLITLQALGAAAVGLNCSTGPEVMEELLKGAVSHAQVPLIAKPNAGKPSQEDPAVYPLSPAEFAEKMESLLAAGAQIVGGCCGSTPEHIRELAQTVENTYRELAPQEPDHFAAAIESESFFLGDDISLSEPLECSYDLGDDLIDIEDEQVNAALVEVNSIDDAKLLIENASMTRLPIVVRIHNLDVLEYTLRNFQGRLIVDSACDLEEEEMRPIVDYYGAILY